MKIIYSSISSYQKKDYDTFRIFVKNKNKLTKLLRYEDQCRSILGEMLLMYLLRQYHIDYKMIHILRNDFGKPYIQNKSLFYNISHSNQYVICAISKREIGIDIEKIRSVYKNVMYQFATKKELLYITKSKQNIYKRLFEIYTLKEAYFKCYGINLNDIKEVEFSIKNDVVICSDSNIKSTLKYDIDGYIIAICEKRS